MQVALVLATWQMTYAGSVNMMKTSKLFFNYRVHSIMDTNDYMLLEQSETKKTVAGKFCLIIVIVQTISTILNMFIQPGQNPEFIK